MDYIDKANRRTSFKKNSQQVQSEESSPESVMKRRKDSKNRNKMYFSTNASVMAFKNDALDRSMSRQRIPLVNLSS